MKFLQNIILVLFVASLLAGCSTVQVNETWRSPEAVPGHYKKLLVINVNRDENVRKMYEDVVSAELRDARINAAAGHKFVKLSETYNRDEIKAAVILSESDAVLTTGTVNTGNQKTSQQGQGSVLYGIDRPSSWDLLIATMQVNLYDAATSRLVWTATFKATDADNKFHVSRDIGKLLAELLKRDGLI